MPLDRHGYKALIVEELTLPAGLADAAQYADLIDKAFELNWLRHSALGTQHGSEVHALFVKRDVLRALLGKRWALTDDSAPGVLIQRRQSQAFSQLQALLDRVEDEIAALGITAVAATTGAARFGAATGTLTTTAPVAAPAGYVDANDAVYRGSPYGRSG